MRHRPVRRSALLAALLPAAACCGCLPDNAFRTVLGEQLTQSVAVLSSNSIGFLFGLGDAILNTFVATLLSSLA